MGLLLYRSAKPTGMLGRCQHPRTTCPSVPATSHICFSVGSRMCSGRIPNVFIKMHTVLGAVTAAPGRFSATMLVRFTALPATRVTFGAVLR